MNRRAKELYEELGPMLFARAARVLKNDKLAQEVTLAVIEELATAGKMTQLELARRGRDLVKHRCAAAGAAMFDSIMPGEPIKR
jgi:hypothetical protein